MPVPPVAPIAPIPPSVGSGAAAPTQGAAGGGFGEVLSQAVSGLNALQTGANTAATQLAAGNTADISTAMVAVEKANLALQLAVEVRNRAVNAYQQIMQMQV